MAWKNRPVQTNLLNRWRRKRRMNDIDFARVLEMQRNIPGWMAEASAAVWCVLLQAQHETWARQGRSTSGDYLEIGVFNGKSASVLANFSNVYGNALAIVDPQILPKTKQTLDAISPHLKYIESRSEELQASDFCVCTHRRTAQIFSGNFRSADVRKLACRFRHYCCR